MVDETEMAQYRRRLRDWEKERERQINEFTITEKDLLQAQPKKPRSTESRKPKHSKLTRGQSADNFLKVDKLEAEENLYTTRPKEKTYKQYKVASQNTHCDNRTSFVFQL